MKLTERLTHSLFNRIVMQRPPDQVIGGLDHPYLKRWYVIPRNRIFNVYLHCFIRSDDDRALHDHPWAWCSILLRGSYTEWSRSAPPGGRRFEAGSIRFHLPSFAHRIVIDEGSVSWTLFITGPRVRRWGFHCPKGWVFWKDFVDPSDPGLAGPGCGEP